VSGAGPIVVVALLALWPFSSEDESADGRVGSVEPAPDSVIEDEPIVVDPERARDHYARYLEIETGADSALRAVALRRLADLTLEVAESLHLDQGLTPLTRAELDRAIELYRAFLEENPHNAAAPDARYQLARALELNEQSAASVAALDGLVGKSGDSPILAEAQFRRGEALFSRRDWSGAEQAYAAVVALGDGPFAEQARYKHGWSLFKQGRHEESLGSFFAVLDTHLSAGASEADLASLDRPRRELLDDTLRAVSIGFSYLDGPESVRGYLGGRGRQTPYDALVYGRLGALYLEQERYQDAAATFEAYVATHLDADDAPAMQVKVADALQAGGFGDHVLDAKKQYVERFGMGGGYWRDRDPESQPEAWSYLKETVDQLARHYHARAQAGGSAEDLAEAARWYEEWLAAFPDDAGAGEHRFLLAEVLFEAGSYEAAARAYEQAAYGYVDFDRAPEAGYAALLAWREMDGREPAGGFGALAVESALRFADTFPSHEHANAVRTKASEDLFAAGDLPGAAAQARIILLETEDATDDLRRTASLVMGHASFDLEDFATAEQVYGLALGLLASGDAERSRVEERLAASIYSQAAAAATAGETELAVNHYQRVWTAVPDSEIAATADYDAAVLLMDAAQWELAVDAMTVFRDRYPGHELQNQVTVNLAAALMETGDRGRAADELLRIAGMDGQEADVRRASLWEAASLKGEAGDVDGAIAAWASYVQRYPYPLDQAMQARQTLAGLAREAGDDTQTIFWLEALVAADADSGEARTELSRTLAARATIELAEPNRLAFESVALTAPLDRALQRKKALMETALADYARAATYGISEVTTESTYRIAEIYHHFGSALLESERPAELDPEALDQYEILLEEQAYPFEEQAIAIHKSNAVRARDGVYDSWVVQSFEALAELVPARYARQEMGERLVQRID
jgi:TolA-binding protein